MTKRHDAMFDDVLKGLDSAAEGQTKARNSPEEAARNRASTARATEGVGGSSRFLKRAGTLAEQAAGTRQETVLRLVDPAECRMWARHNRDYGLLTEETCRDLIDGIRAQGRQEFPAIVRRLPDGEAHRYEVICGARRHFAITWLRANTYPQFKYLIEERSLSDEEAFRLADIENRDREDISDYERARDYAEAVALYYEGKQKRMAERLECSEAWLSRFLALARLPEEIVAAFASVRDIKELYARQLKPLLAGKESRAAVLAEAQSIGAGEGGLPAAEVMARLKAAGSPPKKRKVAEPARAVTIKRAGDRVRFEFTSTLPDEALREAVEAFLTSRAAKGELPTGKIRENSVKSKI